LRRHRDKWWSSCEINENEKVFQSISLNVKRKYESQDLHKYRLLIDYTNISSSVQKGYLLQLIFPAVIPFDITDLDVEEPVNIEGQKYIKIQIESHTNIFPQQTIPVINDDWFFFEYEMNENLFSNPNINKWKFILKLYFPDNQPMIITKPWNEMHGY